MKNENVNKLKTQQEERERKGETLLLLLLLLLLPPPPLDATNAAAAGSQRPRLFADAAAACFSSRFSLPRQVLLNLRLIAASRWFT